MIIKNLFKCKSLIAFFGGVVALFICAVMVYVDTGSKSLVIQALKLEYFPREGNRIPLAYGLMAISPIIAFYEFTSKNSGKEGDDLKDNDN